MIYNLDSTKEKWLKDCYNQSMKELNKFWNMDWTENLPKIHILKNRKTMDQYKGKKTNEWSTAFIRNNEIFLLSPESFEKDSIHKFTKKSYCELIKHELCHCFFRVISENKNRVIWLDEGLAIYTSEMTESQYKKPIKFSKFLSSFHKHDEKVYEESGYFVKILVEKYGKEKIIDLVKKLKQGKTEKEFNFLFKSIYGFELNYENINNLK